MRYLRIPADENQSLQGFVRLRAALQDARQREAAVARYVARNLEGGRASLAGQLTFSARRMLGLFAGVDAIRGRKPGGLQAIADFVEEAVPPAERETLYKLYLEVFFPDK